MTTCEPGGGGSDPSDPDPGGGGGTPSEWVIIDGSCSNDSCFQQVMQDPEVKRAITAAEAVCGQTGGKTTIRCKSDAGCQQRTDQHRDCRKSTVTICLYSLCSEVSKALLKRQIIHELTHAKQVCLQGCDFYKDCEWAVCNEIEAYCREGPPEQCQPSSICQNACESASGKCPISAWACRRFCESMFTECSIGGTPPPRRY